MENASKALLIAGSVLICILLIGLGVKIFTKTKGVSNQVETTGNAISNKATEKSTEIEEELKKIK